MAVLKYGLVAFCTYLECGCGEKLWRCFIYPLNSWPQWLKCTSKVLRCVISEIYLVQQAFMSSIKHIHIFVLETCKRKKHQNLNCILRTATYGGRGEEGIQGYKSPSSGMLAKAKRVFAFLLLYHYKASPWTAAQSFSQSLRQQTCQQLTW